ncbi:SHOCT domain-containing protein [Mucilaginibacter sp. UR6-11]|uniref:SHOCT domain-containing protein n=1 Tax=Mucilaginibacter sp. UR6-11 TaxID=1435644 RepID=UPI001E3028B2|nr:SHOCT domain-containing protein [Mucilaginibacter sp. UR6-11]MCC8424644.1 SHOCT domain-containing protein [Mucilaginibacter sp. UR6-11]
MQFAIICLFFAIICAIVGSKRKIGAVAGFFLGLFLALIGLIIVLSSKKLEDQAMESAMLQAMSQQPAATASTADELQKLAALHAANQISDEEYERLKSKLIN